MRANITIAPMTPGDWPAVKTIYQQGLDSGIASFESSVSDWPDWDSGHLAECRLVARRSGRVCGWAALAPVSSRTVYAGVAELSIYVHPDENGQGIGGLLLWELIKASEQAGYWTLQSGVFPQNNASRRLHEKHGFREVGRREKIAQRDGLWHDLILMERRSSVTGHTDKG
ncbi:GNAT family N-acetyltransferase [Salisediminibacterium halotolerans]|uniref:GNAT family N-acetyltransferase n=1 Tax=Salisediminibacterium halotolerans TaxID=517425 RepID=UPI000F2B76BA|nr:GNAT family N-acetyltransferase [Salisediminibacterium halotolerans]RLJ73153.1 phosphinothricin acetyltransferase [Actinophytocola xinjiangensis]RPE86575.1 phosphinothricin acetyltransferase [Salisediminibacterium halotolerans]TWG33950.1 phosphinothricin acetyltransferase [Salisediminibacterium halotolerans]GEL06641.1 phosphinothricin N-acetyltransferase [Salisediminibacterium halotolerans]